MRKLLRLYRNGQRRLDDMHQLLASISYEMSLPAIRGGKITASDRLNFRWRYSEWQPCSDSLAILFVILTEEADEMNFFVFRLQRDT